MGTMGRMKKKEVTGMSGMEGKPDLTFGARYGIISSVD